jgi:cyclic dehypoxanthinyl futalosine synthase
MTNFELIQKFSDDERTKEILLRAMNNEMLGLKDGVKLLKSHALDLIGAAADVLREKSAGDLVTFVVDRNINYTNICSSKCKFCAFYREPGSEDAYVLTIEEIMSKIDESVRSGATQILLQGGLNPEISVEYYEEILRTVKKRFNVQMHAFSPPEIICWQPIHLVSLPQQRWSSGTQRHLKKG